jgi:catechol 2,3-dioxygenase-like lactoylglutathione lyase family enzyme
MLQGLRGIQHVSISASVIGRSLAYYRDVLDFPELDGISNRIWPALA